MEKPVGKRTREAREAAPRTWLTADAVVYHSAAPAYCEFSNFHEAPFELDGARYWHVEGAFQAAKFAAVDPAHAAHVGALRDPAAAKRAGGKRGVVRLDAAARAAWDARKEDVMLAALRSKFAQHARLRALLLSTGDAPLVERPAGRFSDRFWGCGGAGTGENRHGVLLMRVRAELAAAAGSQDA
jgi:ribA/ribD-fused uncharacterized protein